ncbi:MAG: hypothetical protein JXB13_19875 [Phycisphaerae bacterium]|nr:hypothetical protein [Phycisphaerae bacterium]
MSRRPSAWQGLRTTRVGGTLPMLSMIVLVAVTTPAMAEPAWGANCLSCHGQWQTDSLAVIDADGLLDPDESATGAPDRGPLPTFRTSPDRTRTLVIELTNLAPDDTYAVELRRLRFAGVENGGVLEYTGDCDWPEWGEQAYYYTDPVIAYTWGLGPTLFVFHLEVGPTAAIDYYDLVFAVAGRRASDRSLFYADEHVYVRVGIHGDLNDDGAVDLSDYLSFQECLSGPGVSTPPMYCTPDAFRRADLDEDEDVDLADFAAFQAAFTGS